MKRAIQGSSFESSLKWHLDLSEHLADLGLGLITLEKQGISQNDTNLFEYNQNNYLENRHQDYLLCLENLHTIIPEWQGKLIFLGESEGGTLAANLAKQFQETAAVLLLATGGGIKPKEEIKWAIRHRLEKHEAPLDQIDEYMTCLDDQLDSMMLDPDPNKKFLGNTYKWWASLLVVDELSSALTQLSLPIYLVHGIEDEQIPIFSADLASDLLKKTNALTYIRLEDSDHNLKHPDIYISACKWLQSILFGQENPPLNQPSSIHTSSTSSSEDWQTDISHYVFNRGGKASAKASASQDSEGNKKASVGVEVEKNWDCGVSCKGEFTGSANQNNREPPKKEVTFEIKVSVDL